MDWLRRLFGGGQPAERATTDGARPRSRRPAPSAPLPDGMAGVVTALEQGRKIEAIKRYRQERPRIGLAEAKAAVEALARDMDTAAPSVARMELLREAALTLAAACRVQAIARHRQLHPGVGLAEARAAVAALEGQPRRLGGAAPAASASVGSLAPAPLAAEPPPAITGAGGATRRRRLPGPGAAGRGRGAGAGRAHDRGGHGLPRALPASGAG